MNYIQMFETLRDHFHDCPFDTDEFDDILRDLEIQMEDLEEYRDKCWQIEDIIRGNN